MQDLIQKMADDTSFFKKELEELESKWFQVKNFDSNTMVFRNECEPSTDNPLLMRIERKIKEIEDYLNFSVA